MLFRSGQSLGNSMNATFTGHDDADYYLALGGGLAWTPHRGSLAGWRLEASAERQRTMTTRSGSRLADWFAGSGVLAPNPPIVEGDWMRGRLVRALGGVVQGTLGAELLTDGSSTTGGRGWMDLRVPFSLAHRTGKLTLRGGYAAGDTLPQLSFRLGGPWAGRGYGYGEGGITRHLWAAQLDVGLKRSWLISPVIFGDVAGADFTARPLIGAGAGLSFFGGWLRLNVAKGLNPGRKVRFDLLFGAPR